MNDDNRTRVEPGMIPGKKCTGGVWRNATFHSATEDLMSEGLRLRGEVLCLPTIQKIIAANKAKRPDLVGGTFVFDGIAATDAEESAYAELGRAQGAFAAKAEFTSEEQAEMSSQIDRARIAFFKLVAERLADECDAPHIVEGK